MVLASDVMVLVALYTAVEIMTTACASHRRRHLVIDYAQVPSKSKDIHQKDDVNCHLMMDECDYHCRTYDPSSPA